MKKHGILGKKKKEHQYSCGISELPGVRDLALTSSMRPIQRDGKKSGTTREERDRPDPQDAVKKSELRDDHGERQNNQSEEAAAEAL